MLLTLCLLLVCAVKTTASPIMSSDRYSRTSGMYNTKKQHTAHKRKKSLRRRRRRANRRRRFLRRNRRRLRRRLRRRMIHRNRHASKPRSIRERCLIAAHKQCLVFMSIFFKKKNGYKCTNARAKRLLRKRRIRRLLCAKAAKNVCSNLHCKGQNHLSESKCLIHVPEKILFHIKNICFSQRSANARASADAEKSNTKSVPADKTTSKSAETVRLPSPSPSSSISMTPSSSPSITASTSPSASASTSASPSASSSASASVSATPSKSASPSVSVSASPSVSVSASPSETPRPACEIIEGQVCASTCPSSFTNVFAFQCDGGNKCCRPPDCDSIGGQSCAASCAPGLREQTNFFCQPGHKCCKLPECSSRRDQQCTKSCEQNSVKQTDFFCEGQSMCCRAPSCTDKLNQSCHVSCGGYKTKGYGYCEEKSHVCCLASAEKATDSPSAVTAPTLRPTIAPSQEAMITPTFEEELQPSPNVEEGDAESEGDSIDCADNGGECAAACTSEGTQADSTLTCTGGLKCCIAPEPTKCEGEYFKCIAKTTTCSGQLNDALPGCSESTRCCEVEACVHYDNGKCKDACGTGEKDEYECTFGKRCCIPST